MRWIVVLFLVAGVSAKSIKKRFGIPTNIADTCDYRFDSATYVADPTNCQSYYQCDNGWPILKQCPENTIWTPLGKLDGLCRQPQVARNDICGFVPTDIRQEDLGVFDPAFGKCEFTCADAQQCIAWSAVCDGRANCDDASDEVDCAEPCDTERCRLPDCRCSGSSIPANLTVNEVPQIVMLTWESALRVQDQSHIIEGLLKKIQPNRRRELRRNPNGCPFSMTFFVEHQFTNYALAQYLYANGHEIATMSVR
ncbi:PREDICTED: uncharacterized protein LOC106809132 [Priapulus caudatus]|uniref:Uncharacterized protein LOC106809132 n=1 Tax=Priapulus caudatus TaxID=37621 RepID=A0ABM1E5X2_PRICU|nr:PREDICTED: uncharacterized protein LOC106809132 [Priapulus caudatus]